MDFFTAVVDFLVIASREYNTNTRGHTDIVQVPIGYCTVSVRSQTVVLSIDGVSCIDQHFSTKDVNDIKLRASKLHLSMVTESQRHVLALICKKTPRPSS